MDNSCFRILVVDDMPKNLALLKTILSKKKYNVTTTTSGYEALDIVKMEEIDLILLDIIMPDIGGFEVCDQLKSDPNYKDIPIIFLSGETDNETIVKGFKLGAQDYIKKPFNLYELLARVRTHIDLKSKTYQLKSINQELEKKVQERTYELNQANKRLSRLEKAKSNFLGLIAHELRTPLTSIVGINQILKETFNTEEQKNYLSFLENAIERLRKFSETSLLITSITLDHFHMKINPINLKDLVLNCVNHQQQNSELKNIKIITEFIDDDIIINGDIDLLLKSIKIIIDNSIKYSNPDSKVIIRQFREGDFSCICIRDFGKGFSKDSLDSLFEPFAIDDMMHHSHGFGLGLFVVKLVLDVHKAEIKIQNESDTGASVTIKFMNSDK